MDLKTPISLLQEYLVKEGVMPSYNLVYNGGSAHDPIFRCNVKAKGVSATGKGRSKQDAKQDAAKLLLLRLKGAEIWKDEVHIISPRIPSVKGNWIGALQEYCVEHCNSLPHYQDFTFCGEGHTHRFGVRCTVLSVSRVGKGSYKQEAKHAAARQVLWMLKNEPKITETPQDVKEKDHLAVKPFNKTKQAFRKTSHSRQYRAHSSPRTLRDLFNFPEELLDMIVKQLGDRLVQGMLKGDKRMEELQIELAKLAKRHDEMIDDFKSKAKQFKMPPEHLKYEYYQPVVRKIISEQMMDKMAKFNFQDTVVKYEE